MRCKKCGHHAIPLTEGLCYKCASDRLQTLKGYSNQELRDELAKRKSEQKAQAEIESTTEPAASNEKDPPLLTEQVLKILTDYEHGNKMATPASWIPTEIADKLDPTMKHGFRFVRAINASLVELENQGKVTLTRDRNTIRYCSLNQEAKS